MRQLCAPEDGRTPGSGTISPVPFGPVESVTVIPKAFASSIIAALVFVIAAA